ncbi:MAG: hypothetical protein EOP22_20025, partial [Hyphomicrobiales bacterium]
MSDITLSKAVRSNLLNLQSTAELLGKSQERLSTGLRVNSALDNPTNFFTAQGLNSRANDLSQLLDSVSNAVQTVAAADKGISAITKLVESAQATARQALQTAATVGSAGPATSGTVTAGAFSTLDVSGAGSSASAGVLTGTGFANVDVSGTSSSPTAGVLTGTGFANVDVSGTGSSASAGVLTGTGFANVDVSGTGTVATASTFTAANTFTNIDLTDDAADALTFDVDLGGTAVTITLDRAGSGAGGAGGDNIYDIDEAIAEIQAQLNAHNSGAGLGVTVGKDGLGTSLTFTADTAGATALTVSSAAVVDGGTGGGVLAAVTNLGISDAATTGQTDTGDAFVAADSISFSVTVDGGSPDTVTIDDAAVSAYNLANSTSLDASALTAQNIVDLINEQTSSTVASLQGGQVRLQSGTTGTSSSVAVGAISTTGSASNTTGLTGSTSDSGDDLVAADSISFSITVDGGSPDTVTIDDAAVSAYNLANSTSLDASALTAQNIVDLINDQTSSTVASLQGGQVRLQSGTTGSSSSVAVGAISTTGSATNTTGLTGSSSDSGDALVAADSFSFTLAVDGASPQTITINAAAVTAYNTANSTSLSASALSAQNVADIINHQSGPDVASVVSGALTFTSTTTGTGSSIAIAGFASAGTVTGSSGIANANNTGSATSSTGPNPKRDELVDTYNDLLGQIDALAKDASFNGVNLLNGDNLSVLFNEDGSSKLDIKGVTNNAAGLGLTALADGAFNSNASINSTLDGLKGAIDTLRTQAGKFG